MERAKPLYQAIIRGDAKSAKTHAEEELARGTNPQEIVDEQMIPAMDEVGRMFECRDFYVPEMLISARAMKAALEVLRPRLIQEEVASKGKVVVGTVKGDLHDIGKNLVAAMLEGAGYEIIDLGVDVETEKFVSVVTEHRPTILALSALLTTTMPGMKTVIEALSEANLRKGLKILVGGAPITAEFARKIGADGYGESSTSAVTLARELTSAAS